MASRRILPIVITAFALSLSLRAQTHLSWKPLCTGVNRTVPDSNLGHDVFCGFGGWTIRQEWANIWVGSLYSARLRTLGVRYLFSVMGPKQDDYSGRELDTRALARSLVAIMKSDTLCRRIIVAAHSSGSFVAHALFHDLYGSTGIDSLHVTDGTIIYFNLDGGIGNGGTAVPITPGIAERLAHLYAVYAFAPENRLYSPNRADMVELAGMFAPRSRVLQIDVTGCGCSAAWCVHETLIVQRPHNPTTFDLEHDYDGIDAEHPVTTSYLDVLNNTAR